MEKYNDAIEIDKKGQSLKTDLDNIKQEVNVKLEKIKKLGDLEYDEDCDYCMKNPFTLDAIETKKSIDDDKKKVKDLLIRIDGYNKWYQNNWIKVNSNYVDYQETTTALEKITTLINQSKQEKQLLNEKQNNYLNQNLDILIFFLIVCV